MNKVFISFTVLMFLLSLGCSKGYIVKSGRPFDEAYIGLIEEGRTAAEDIAKTFGSPHKEIIGTDGRRSWVYYYRVEGLWSQRGNAPVSLGGEEKMLSINFDKDGYVKNYAYFGSDMKVFPSNDVPLRIRSQQDTADVDFFDTLEQVVDRLEEEKIK